MQALVSVCGVVLATACGMEGESPSAASGAAHPCPNQRVLLTLTDYATSPNGAAILELGANPVFVREDPDANPDQDTTPRGMWDCHPVLGEGSGRRLRMVDARFLPKLDLGPTPDVLYDYSTVEFSQVTPLAEFISPQFFLPVSAHKAYVGLFGQTQKHLLRFEPGAAQHRATVSLSDADKVVDLSAGAPNDDGLSPDVVSGVLDGARAFVGSAHYDFTWNISSQGSSVAVVDVATDTLEARTFLPIGNPTKMLLDPKGELGVVIHTPANLWLEADGGIVHVDRTAPYAARVLLRDTDIEFNASIDAMEWVSNREVYLLVSRNGHEPRVLLWDPQGANAPSWTQDMVVEGAPGRRRSGLWVGLGRLVFWQEDTNTGKGLIKVFDIDVAGSPTLLTPLPLEVSVPVYAAQAIP